MFYPSLHHPLKEGKLQEEQDLRSTSVWTTVPTTTLSRCNTQANPCYDLACHIVCFSHGLESDKQRSVPGVRSCLSRLALVSSDHNVQFSVLLLLCSKTRRITPDLGLWALRRCRLWPRWIQWWNLESMFPPAFLPHLCSLFDNNTCSDILKAVLVI